MKSIDSSKSAANLCLQLCFSLNDSLLHTFMPYSMSLVSLHVLVELREYCLCSVYWLKHFLAAACMKRANTAATCKRLCNLCLLFRIIMHCRHDHLIWVEPLGMYSYCYGWLSYPHAAGMCGRNRNSCDASGPIHTILRSLWMGLLHPYTDTQCQGQDGCACSCSPTVRPHRWLNNRVNAGAVDIGLNMHGVHQQHVLRTTGFSSTCVLHPVP